MAVRPIRSDLDFGQLHTRFTEVFDDHAVEFCLQMESQFGQPDLNPGSNNRIIKMLCRYFPSKERKNLHQHFFKKTPLGRLDLSARELMLLNVSIFEANEVLDRSIDRFQQMADTGQLSKIHGAQICLHRLVSNRLTLDAGAKSAVEFLSSLANEDGFALDDEFKDAVGRLN